MRIYNLPTISCYILCVSHAVYKKYYYLVKRSIREGFVRVSKTLSHNYYNIMSSRVVYITLYNIIDPYTRSEPKQTRAYIAPCGHPVCVHCLKPRYYSFDVRPYTCSMVYMIKYNIVRASTLYMYQGC